MEKNIFDPLGIILVSSGSKGDRLLFRYPFESTGNAEESVKSKKSPYAQIVTSDPFSQKRKLKSSIQNGELVGYTDTILTNLLAVKSDLCGKKFELRIDDVLFVGFPLLLQSGSGVSYRKDQPTMISFNVVFALRTNVAASVINCYHDLAKQIAVALRHEQTRCNYLSQQKSIMWGIQDDIASLPEDAMESPFPLILQKCPLAKHMKHIYDGLCSTGIILLRINKWVDISFCLPHKVHNAGIAHKGITVEPEAVQRCLSALKPYHAVLLLEDENKLLDSLPLDCSPSLIRVIKVSSPLRSLQSLASDADLALSQVFQLVSHLVDWAKATIIYPLCETNVYVISPYANTMVNSTLVEEFTERFAHASLACILSEFSLPTPYGEHRDFLGLPQHQARQVQMVIWLLQHRLLLQLHTYINFVPPKLPHIHVSSSQNQQRVSVDHIADTSSSGNIKRPSSLSDVESVTSDGSPNILWNRPSPETEAGMVVTEEMKANWRIQEMLGHLTGLQKQSLQAVPAASNPEDLKTFAKLSPYFNGKHHLEDIMYYENVRRSQLLTLLDKFRSVLITCTHQDPATSFHVPS
ncbi:GATOR1 complex protein NPRL3-like [Lineus longissimus]|uniref:GATOR1 complex protein NPRL3-like n=1 Tax=Lineus longissimus TaxID=88925 RepID=UPI00315D8CC5